jgi:L-iditol 2-dehydrogenase
VTLLSARAAGAEPVIITDLDANRLAFAKTVIPGVRTILVDRNATAKDTARKIREAADGIVPRVALECTGAESSVHAAIYVSLDFMSYIVI